MSEPRPELESKVVKLAPLAGVALLAACGLYALVSPADVLKAYLVAFAYWWTLAIGGLALAALHQLVSGRWGLLVSRAFEAMARTLPAVGIAFVPIALGLGLVYPWYGAEDLGNKGAWLEPTGFVARAIGYFVVWCLLEMLITRGSIARDKEWKKGQRERLIKLGAAASVIFVLTTTFAAIDWFMSLEPEWFSTIYGGLFVADAGRMALALGIIVLWLRYDREPNREYATTEMWGDLGNLLLAFTMIWGYFNFSQFIIIWSADLPVEAVWYHDRIAGWWLVWAIATAFLQFLVPFTVLVNPDVRRTPGPLAAVSAFVLVVQVVDHFWKLAPAFGDGQWAVWLLVWPLWLGLGGVWLGLFGWQLGRFPLLPVNDPAAERHRRRVANGHGHSDHAHAHATAQPEATS